MLVMIVWLDDHDLYNEDNPMRSSGNGILEV